MSKKFENRDPEISSRQKYAKTYGYPLRLRGAVRWTCLALALYELCTNLETPKSIPVARRIYVFNASLGKAAGCCRRRISREEQGGG